jgi:hypothetical protein
MSDGGQSLLMWWTAPAPGIECHWVARRRRRKGSLFSALQNVVNGTLRHFAAPQKSVAIGGIADIGRHWRGMHW